jgi:ribosome-associated protein
LNNKNIATDEAKISSETFNNLIVSSIQDIKGKDISVFDLRELEMASNDFFIICHGTSRTQLIGIINNIEKRVFEETGIRPNHSEGRQGTNWMLVDYFSVIVHIFTKEKRDFYNLEDLWSDAKIQKFDNSEE